MTVLQPKIVLPDPGTSPHGDRKRLRPTATDSSLNRLSKLQKKLICSAYLIYAKNPRLAPDDMDFSPWPPLTLDDIKAGKYDEEARPHRTPHLFTPEAIAAYLGVSPSVWNGWSRLDRGHWFHRQQQPSYRCWRSVYVDPKRYATAHASVCRALVRIAQRGLAFHHKRYAYDGNSAIVLNVAGIALGQKLTGIEPAPRA